MDLRHARSLARGLLDLHGLQDWTLVLDRAKTRAGVCRPHRREIGLSAHLTRLHPEEEVRDTVLHEIAHALVGPRHGHGPVWRAKALEIGCSAQRCSSTDVPQVEGPWIGTCPAGHVRRRHRRPTRVASCSRCSAVFDPAHLLAWTHLGRKVPMHPNYEAELAALRDPRQPRSLDPLTVGDRVRVVAPGRFHGTVGEIHKRGRTRFHIRVPGGVLTVPFSLVEAA